MLNSLNFSHRTKGTILEVSSLRTIRFERATFLLWEIIGFVILVPLLCCYKLYLFVFQLDIYMWECWTQAKRSVAKWPHCVNRQVLSILKMRNYLKRPAQVVQGSICFTIIITSKTLKLLSYKTRGARHSKDIGICGRENAAKGVREIKILVGMHDHLSKHKKSSIPNHIRKIFYFTRIKFD